MIYLLNAAAASADRPTDPSIYLLAVIGFGSVFVVLMIFWLIISLMQKNKDKNSVASPVAEISTDVDTHTQEQMLPAKNSHGECDLHDVDDKTAAFIMAIVADKMQAPLNELYFKSIQEIKK